MVAKKADLCRRPLRAPKENVEGSCDSRDRRQNVSQTRQSAKKTRTAKHIAWHHFHPIAIKEHCLQDTSNGKFYKYVDTLPGDFVKASIGVQDGYAASDVKLCDGTYYMVPSYPITQAESDIQLVERHVSLHKVLADVVKRRRSDPERRTSTDGVKHLISKGAQASQSQKRRPMGAVPVDASHDRIVQLEKRNAELEQVVYDGRGKAIKC